MTLMPIVDQVKWKPSDSEQRFEDVTEFLETGSVVRNPTQTKPTYDLRLSFRNRDLEDRWHDIRIHDEKAIELKLYFWDADGVVHATPSWRRIQGASRKFEAVGVMRTSSIHNFNRDSFPPGLIE